MSINKISAASNYQQKYQLWNQEIDEILSPV
jgi:hypothetical protein